jgi:sulfonate transport system substrate-binding protein
MIASSRRTFVPCWVRGFRALNPKQFPGFAFLFSLVFSLILVMSSCSAQTGDNPGTIRLDFAYYNPVSLVLKENGWLEEELAQDNISVEWVQSLGSNKALELLNSRSIDFGSTAGAAALLGKANGNPIKSVYIYSKPEWTALVTTADSDINTVEDLQGRKVAVTRGTDPHIFLLRALDQVGLSEQDIEVVQLQHADGKTALERGDVDAWAGLDPHMAQTELEKGSRLFFRDPDLNTYGFLNVREAFAQQYPTYVERVLAVYERARQWSLENPDELKAILQKEAKLSDAVASKQLERTDLSNSVIGQVHKDTIIAAGDVLKSSGVIPGSIDVNQVADELVDPQFVEKVARHPSVTSHLKIASHQSAASHQKITRHPQHSLS